MLAGEHSLTQALQNQLQEFRSVTSVQADFSVTGKEQSLREATGAALVRIVQEGLANVYRHSEATHVDVKLAFEEGLVHLEIRDNGKGFSRPDVRPDSLEGRGLTNMTQRAQELGGSLTIDSIIGQGTSVDVSIPLPPDGSGEVP